MRSYREVLIRFTFCNFSFMASTATTSSLSQGSLSTVVNRRSSKPAMPLASPAVNIQQTPPSPSMATVQKLELSNRKQLYDSWTHPNPWPLFVFYSSCTLVFVGVGNMHLILGDSQGYALSMWRSFHLCHSTWNITVFSGAHPPTSVLAIHLTVKLDC